MLVQTHPFVYAYKPEVQQDPLKAENQMKWLLFRLQKKRPDGSKWLICVGVFFSFLICILDFAYKVLINTAE